MRRFENLAGVTPPKWAQAAAIVLVGVLPPVYLFWGSPSWQQNWTVGAILSLSVCLLIVGGFAFMAFGITGGNVTTKEQDKEFVERWERYYQRYWWIPFSACLLWVVYAAFMFYA